MLIKVKDTGTKLCHRVPHGFPCVGARCMAWRWAEEAKSVFPAFVAAGPGVNREPAERPPGVGEDWTWRSAQEDQDAFLGGWVEPKTAAEARAVNFNTEERHGYCGAIGEPEYPA